MDLRMPCATGAMLNMSEAATTAKEQVLIAQNARLQQQLSSEQAALAAERETQRQLQQQQAALAQQRLTWQAHAEMVPQVRTTSQPAVANAVQHHPPGGVAALYPQVPAQPGSSAFPAAATAGGELGGVPQQMFVLQQPTAPRQMPVGGTKMPAQTEVVAGPVGEGQIGGHPTGATGATAARPPAFLPSPTVDVAAERLPPVPKTPSGKRDAMSLATGAGWTGKPTGNKAVGVGEALRADGDDAGGDSGDDVEKKKIMRAERNRQSAAASRERKKDLIRAQERRVSSLSKENAALQLQHINTKRTFMELTKSNRSMKSDVRWPPPPTS